MYIQRSTVTRYWNIYTSSAILTTWYFTRTQFFMTPEKRKWLLGSSYKVPDIFVRFLTKFGSSQQIIVKGSNIKSHGNPFATRRTGTCGKTGRTDVMTLNGASRELRESRLKMPCPPRCRTPSSRFFNVLLTVHLSIISLTDQLNAQILVL